MYQIQTFKDRQSLNPNKRKITVLEQNSNEIIANIEPIAEDIIEEGTPFNAELMEKFQSSIVQSETDSKEALSIAQAAKSQSQEVFDHVADNQGTKVTENGVFVLNFNADKKVNVADFEALLSRVVALENNPVIKNISFDEATNTFTI